MQKTKISIKFFKSGRKNKKKGLRRLEEEKKLLGRGGLRVLRLVVLQRGLDGVLGEHWNSSDKIMSKTHSEVNATTMSFS